MYNKSTTTVALLAAIMAQAARADVIQDALTAAVSAEATVEEVTGGQEDTGEAADGEPIVNQYLIFDDQVTLDVEVTQGDSTDGNYDPTLGTPISRPKYTVPKGCCILYTEENYRGLQQRVCDFNTKTLAIPTVKSVACAEHTIGVVAGLPYDDMIFFYFYENAVPALTLPDEANAF